MLRAIYTTFSKIFAVIRAIRAGLLGIALVLTGWIFLTPATQTEQAAIGFDTTTPADKTLLRAHRMAKIVAAIDSDRLYSFAATQAGDGVTATQIRDNVTFAADGFGQIGGSQSQINTQNQTLGADATQKAFVGSGGAKFVRARTN